MIMENLKSPLRIIFGFISLMWVFFFLQIFLPLRQLGIVPRSLSGLWGVLLSPFLHGSLFHLLANTFSLIVLGLLFFASQGKKALSISAGIIIIGGLGTWLIGRSGTVHIGASTYIYGLMGFSLTVGIFQKSLVNIVYSVLILALYGGALWGLLPLNPYISWEGHLCGFAAGILIAKFSGEKN